MAKTNEKAFEAFRNSMDNFADYFFEKVCDMDPEEVEMNFLYNIDATACTVVVNPIGEENDVLFSCSISEEEADEMFLDELLAKLLTVPVVIGRDGDEVEIAVSAIWKTNDGFRVVPYKTWVDGTTMDFARNGKEVCHQEGLEPC